MMKGQLAGLMKQAQAMQDNLKRAQEELATIEVEGQSGAGLVAIHQARVGFEAAEARLSRSEPGKPHERCRHGRPAIRRASDRRGGHTASQRPLPA